MVDVLDRDRADFDARAAGDAVPDRLLGDRGRDERRQFGAGAAVRLSLLSAELDDRRAVGEHLVAQAHDHKLR